VVRNTKLLINKGRINGLSCFLELFENMFILTNFCDSAESDNDKDGRVPSELDSETSENEERFPGEDFLITTCKVARSSLVKKLKLLVVRVQIILSVPAIGSGNSFQLYKNLQVERLEFG